MLLLCAMPRVAGSLVRSAKVVSAMCSRLRPAASMAPAHWGRSLMFPPLDSFSLQPSCKRCIGRQAWPIDESIRREAASGRTSTACGGTGSFAAVYPTDSYDGGQLPAASHTMSSAEKEQMARELHSLNVAITANVLICAAKVWVHLISGSSAMLAEAMHSAADVLNQVLLRVGVKQAMKAPTAQHPYGYMRDRFVWSLISAVGIFFLGAGASVLHGLHTLFEARVLEGEALSYAVLGVSALLEGYSLLVAVQHIRTGAAARGMPVLKYINSGVDPTTVAVLMEDGGAVAGLAIAAACTALAHATANPMWDAVGSILVGGLLGCIAMFLVQRNRDLLLGRSMSPGEMQAILGHLKRDPVVAFVTDTKTEEIGPGVFRFKAEVAWNGDQLVERYLQRCGRQRLADRLALALAQEQATVMARRDRAGAGQAGAGAGQTTQTSSLQSCSNGTASGAGVGQQQQQQWGTDDFQPRQQGEGGSSALLPQSQARPAGEGASTGRVGVCHSTA
ncbi:cation efflux family-domain-containing protein [Haematococcus lacustris]